MIGNAALPRWQRLHLALMPDYNRASVVFWWAVVAGGALVLAWALARVAVLPGADLLKVVAAMGLAMLAGLFPMRVPGSKNSFVAGEIFIFLLLLLLGTAAAVVAAAGEAFVGSLRTSRRWTSRLFSPAAAALAMGASGSLLEAVLASLAQAGWQGVATVMAAMMAFALLYFNATVHLVAGVPRLKKREPFWQVVGTLALFRWVGIAYAGNAAVASLLFVAWREAGAGVPLVMMPLVAMVLLTLHFYYRQQEADESLRKGGAAAGVREVPAEPRDADSSQRQLQEMQHLAYHDPLTGLPNRRRFMERLAEVVAANAAGPADPSPHPSAQPHPFAVMYLDFDRFKIVNDSLGHGAGDELLQQVARRIADKLRPQDLVARLGGDEFAVLVADIGHEKDALALAERLMETLRLPLKLADGVEVVATASIGITFSSLGYANADDVLRDADNALYKAKNAGRARYAVFDQSLHTAVSERLKLEGQLRNAVASGQLSVEYQPLIELASKQLTGFEALVRWAHPQRGTLHPAQFLAVAEETGLMPQLSDFVLHCACQQLRRWQQLDAQWAQLTMSVNISAADLGQRSFVARVSRALVEASLRPESLTLELTEDILMPRIDGAMDMLAELKRLGVKLAVDRFGTGHSTLAHLARLPVDILKIDRSFVSRLKSHSEDLAIVRTIVQLGHSLRKSIVAEGIESEAQSELLRGLGCSLGQGFHLGRPLSAQAARAWLQSHSGDPGPLQ